MKKDDVRIDGTYWAKVGTGGVVPVRITAEKWLGNRHAGWVGVNTRTNRSVRIKTAQRLRGRVEGAEAAAAADGAATTAQDGGAGEEGAVTASAGSPRPRAAAGGKAGGAKAGAKAPAAKTTPKAAKAQKTEKAPAPAKPKKLSALDAAARVLAEAGAPMKPKEMIALMESTGLWTSPGGKTPEATLYAAIIREIAARGKEARFRKTERGTFVTTEHAPPANAAAV